MLACPICSAEVQPPRAAYYGTGRYSVTCPNSHSLYVVTSRPDEPEPGQTDAIQPSPGDQVYVVDVTSAWTGEFVGYEGKLAVIQTADGERVHVNPASLRHA